MAFILNRPLYTDKNKTLVLEEGDPKSAFVIGGKGSPVDDENVKKYGLDDSHRLQEENQSVEEAETTDDEEAEEEAESEESDTDEPKSSPSPRRRGRKKK